MLSKIKTSLQKYFDSTLIDELLEAYQEAKRNYSTGGLRLNAVEGGRYCEAAFRILEEATTQSFTPMGTPLNSERLIVQLANTPRSSYSDSVRLHIPRSLRVVYDIRNSRDAAHLGDGIDPNPQDAMLVVSILDWTMAEFVRLYHGCSAEEAQQIINSLVAKKSPAVEDFNGFLKVLKPGLKAGEHILLLLSERGEKGATFNEIETWTKPSMRKNLARSLDRITNEKSHAHFDGQNYFITRSGIIQVEKSRLYEVTEK